MRSLIPAALAMAVVIALAACGSTPSGSGSPTGSSAVQPTATASQPTVATGHECDAVPTFSLGGAMPSFPPDASLEAHFPTTIDGQPVTDVSSFLWVNFLCMFGGQTAVDSALADAGAGTPGLNFATMSFGSATATVDGEEVTLSAFRTPNTDAGNLVNSIAMLTALSGEQGPNGSFTSSTIGGKTVFVTTDTDGSASYAYASGDTLIFTDAVTASQAEKIFAAMP